MNNSTASLKNCGVQLNNLGIEIQNLLSSPVSLQIICVKLNEIEMIILNIATQIINIRTQIDNNIPNLNMFNQYNNIKMNDNLINKLDRNKNNYNLDKIMTIYFNDGITGEKTTINTYEDITVEELLKLYALKVGLKIDNLKDYFFLINGSIIDIKEKRTLKEYKLNNNNLIAIAKSNNVIGGP
jgi:hypothetical protein